MESANVSPITEAPVAIVLETPPKEAAPTKPAAKGPANATEDSKGGAKGKDAKSATVCCLFEVILNQ